MLQYRYSNQLPTGVTMVPKDTKIPVTWSTSAPLMPLYQKKVFPSNSVEQHELISLISRGAASSATSTSIYMARL